MCVRLQRDFCVKSYRILPVMPASRGFIRFSTAFWDEINSVENRLDRLVYAELRFVSLGFITFWFLSSQV